MGGIVIIVVIIVIGEAHLIFHDGGIIAHVHLCWYTLPGVGNSHKELLKGEFFHD
jgi:hypothetical protein